jgi:RimJ/RimL family protein N-acetyltransferase
LTLVLVGERVVLRARRRSDVGARHVALAGDFAVHALTDYAPWRPTTLESAFAEYDERLGQTPDPATERFTVGRRGDPALAWIGEASLWGVRRRSGASRNTSAPPASVWRSPQKRAGRAGD